MTERKWYETHDNLVGLATWLDSECADFAKTADVIYFIEKPWKWTREYHLWQLWIELEKNDEQAERVIDALAEGKTADDVKAELEENDATK